MNKKLIYHYLNIHQKPDELTEHLIDECIKEVEKIAHFKSVAQVFQLLHQPLTILEMNLEIQSQDLTFYFQDCHECVVIACTLGIEIDRKIKYYEHIDMAKAIVFDAVSNAYLEQCCDEYVDAMHLQPHTFRFAPGYGDIPLELNKILSYALQIDKRLGVSLHPGGLFLPMKSMLGIIGIGQEVKKTCLSCIRMNQCELRKEGLRCYVKD